VDAAIVRFKAGVSRPQIDSVNSALGCTIAYAHPYLVNQFLIRMPGDQGTDLLSICRAYYESESCVFAEPNRLSKARINVFPNDPYYSLQWYLHNDGSNGAVDADIDADSAWMVTTGSANVTIGVLDSGLDFDHEDLTGIDTVYCYDAAQSVPIDPAAPVVTDYDPTFDCG
jgi:hypothetical protein